MDFYYVVANLGFPIAITFYVMFRLEKTVKQNTQAINNLSNKIMLREFR